MGRFSDEAIEKEARQQFFADYPVGNWDVVRTINRDVRWALAELSLYESLVGRLESELAEAKAGEWSEETVLVLARYLEGHEVARGTAVLLLHDVYYTDYARKILEILPSNRAVKVDAPDDPPMTTEELFASTVDDHERRIAALEHHKPDHSDLVRRMLRQSRICRSGGWLDTEMVLREAADALAGKGE